MFFIFQDLKPLQVYGIQFLVDNTALAFIAGDADKNLVVFTYNPESHESMGGTRLVRKGEFHLGAHVNAFFRLVSLEHFSVIILIDFLELGSLKCF